MHRIVVTGPESTGKTTLARYLARQTGFPYVPEYAREYLQERNGLYTEADLYNIARGQIDSELFLHTNSPQQPLIADTSLLVIKIWSEHKYGRCDPRIPELLRAHPVDLYFLCAPDLPWVADPLRENPGKGDYFFKWFERELKDMNANYFIVKGIGEERQSRAFTQLKKWLQDHESL